MTESKKITIQALGKAEFGDLSKYPKCTTVLTTELGTAGYKTGLTKEEEAKYEELLGLEKGKLGKKSIFWSELEIRIPAKKIVLDLEDPINYLKYKVCLESSKVANSMLERTKWPGALFVIHDEEEAANIESTKLDFEIEAYEEFMNTSPEQRRGLLKIFGKRGLDAASDAVVKTTLAKIMKQDPRRFLEIKRDKKLETRILVEDFLINNIIKKKGNYFLNGDDPIGNSTDEVIEYLDDPRNQSILVALKGKLKSIKKK